MSRRVVDSGTMRLSVEKKTGLAMKALRLLADDGGTVRAKELAPELESTVHYLPQVLGELVRAGWVKSYPGPTGGYRLVGKLEEHSLLDLVELLEGATDSQICVLEGDPCDSAESCSMHLAWLEARSELMRQLSEIPISSRPKGNRP